ncbi:MAG: hypothetical protein QF662_07085, partial [Phycisphaerae bacterium]|nr:hypothetical protein [Phycisphaerae bacterium]
MPTRAIHAAVSDCLSPDGRVLVNYDAGHFTSGQERLKNAVGPGCGYGCNVGNIKPMDMTFASLMTVDGKLELYLGEGKFTKDPIAKDFFGCSGVAKIEGLQDVLLHVGYNGHRHHVSTAEGHVLEPVYEAMVHYLGWDVSVPQEEA